MAKKSSNTCHISTSYAENVLSDKTVACKWVRLACQRHINDLQNGSKRGIFFNTEKADHALGFFNFLKHSKGEWAGQVFVLEDWQRFIIANVFGWQSKITGFRRYRTAYIEVSRKNGKSTMLAGIGLYLFTGDDEPGAEVYTAATKRDQARITHGEATRMAKSSEMFRETVNIFKDNISCEFTSSKFEPLGADADTMDGLNVHGAIIDELHAHKDRKVWDILDTATGSRRQPLIFGITTAGFDKESICWEQNQYTQKILEGVIEDDTYFGIIYTLDKNDDWSNRAVWQKSNPNFNVSVKEDDLIRKCEQAKEVPTKQNAFLRLHMNVWTESETLWIPMERWKLCGQHVDAEGLRGRRCYGGLDLSSTVDITALVLVFPPEAEGDKYQVLCRFWIPQDNIQSRARRDRVPYDVWVRQGLISATPGNVIDYGFILRQIDEDARKYDLMEVAYDRWGATKVVQDLQNAGMTVADFGQGFASMARPTRELEKMILAEEIWHGNNAVLSWMASNVVIKQDAAGNMKPDKDKSTEKIDGIVALIMALDRAVLNSETKSIYESRGVVAF